MTELAIRVENISKRYRIGALQTRADTLRDVVVNNVRRMGPVSYTHLDVYKRQGHGFGDHFDVVLDRVESYRKADFWWVGCPGPHTCLLYTSRCV